MRKRKTLKSKDKTQKEKKKEKEEQEEEEEEEIEKIEKIQKPKFSLAHSLYQKKFILLLFLFRIANSYLCQTFADPDEYWQSLEVAHNVVYGYGHLTWEWITALRGYLHPMIFAGLYYFLSLLGLDENRFIFLQSPGVLQAFFGSLTDFYTYKIAKHWFGYKVANFSLILSLSSWFMWFYSTRTVSNSLETTLVIIGLYYWSSSPHVLFKSRKKISIAIFLFSIAFMIRPTSAIIFGCLGLWSLKKLNNWNHRFKFLFVIVAPIFVSVFILSTIIDTIMFKRPTIVFWNFLKFNLLSGNSEIYGTHPWHWYLSQGIPAILTSFLPLLLFSIWLQFKNSNLGQSFLNKIKSKNNNKNKSNKNTKSRDQNKDQKKNKNRYNQKNFTSESKSDFYMYQLKKKKQNEMAKYRNKNRNRNRNRNKNNQDGNKYIDYNNKVSNYYPNGNQNSSTGQMYLIFFIIIVNVFVYSLLGHKEFRFLLPIVPLLLIVCSFSLVNFSEPKSTEEKSELTGHRIFFWSVLILLILIQVFSSAYFGMIHQRGRVTVMNFLSDEANSYQMDNKEMDVMFLTQCHATPWYSHIHKNISMSFPDCSPRLKELNNLGKVPDSQFFEEQTLKYVTKKFANIGNDPTHIVTFDNFWIKMKDFLESKNYKICNTNFNTHFPVDRELQKYVYVLCKNE
ncbi:gpi mannosyltransferase 3 [Anaeramoeba flamelloides]|uniref:Mannosyltransferase n=1 Tax=Anaeramoeba flamelloides TaxID=1746091 RepID=A0ABQ8X1W7_9EUKA|nr:gpi mannosyltransferase 3 [Anaeramoeba flamelloides]